MDIKFGYAKVKYAGDGVTTNFTVPFPYLNKFDVQHAAFITATGENVSPDYTFSFINANTVQFTPTPPVGVEVWLERDTSVRGQLVDFASGSTITERDLDTGYLQSLYVAQEALDEAGLRTANAASLDALVAAAQAAETAAGGYAGTASGSASAAFASATAAATSASQAAASATAAATSAASAAASASASVNGKLDKTANLSDVASPSTALANLGGAPLASPAFTGTPTAPTPISSDNSTKLATTAYVQAAMVAGGAGVTSFNSRAGAVTLGSSDVTTALGFTPANKAGETFTGPITVQSTGTGGLVSARTTTTGVLNQGAMQIGRGDVANGYAQTVYFDTAASWGVSSAWATGLRAGDSNYHIFDSVNGVDRVIVTPDGKMGIGGAPTYALDVYPTLAKAARFGTAALGDWFTLGGAAATFFASFGHTAAAGGTGYALLSQNNGDTYLNGAAQVHFRLANVEVGTLDSKGYSFLKNVSMPRSLSVHTYGAVGDWNPTTSAGTDDRASIQSALDACYTAGGGTVVLEPNKKYMIAGPLVIPVGVTLLGPHEHISSGWRGAVGYPVSIADPVTNGGKKIANMGGSIWINFDAGRGNATTPNATSPTAASDWTNNATYDVQDAAGLPNYATRTAGIYVRGTLKGVYVLARGYTNPVTTNGPSDTPTWNYGIATNPGFFAGLAIRQDAEDACVRNCFIGGFMQAILSYNEARGLFEDLLIDCINGIEVSSSYDLCTVRRIHAFPFSTYGYSQGSLSRRGSFVWFHDTVDWGRIESCFTYGHKIGFNLSNVNGVQISNCGADNVDSAGEFTGYKGVQLIGTVQNLAIANFKAANREYGIYADPSASQQVTLTGGMFAGCGWGIFVNTGNFTALGGNYVAGANGVKCGLENHGAGVAKLVNPTFSGLTNNTFNSGTGSVSIL